ncbi:hypothetical protein ACQKMD_16680 [Viridibacillus sp. NPDC096237]|uniref:hypothetical protein n=1 Tax=Viridibacillus sp. NPDC096237 TaxID=3390721 RepID=UPI003D00355A
MSYLDGLEKALNNMKDKDVLAFMYSVMNLLEEENFITLKEFAGEIQEYKEGLRAEE